MGTSRKQRREFDRAVAAAVARAGKAEKPRRGSWITKKRTSGASTRTGGVFSGLSLMEADQALTALRQAQAGGSRGYQGGMPVAPQLPQLRPGAHPHGTGGVVVPLHGVVVDPRTQAHGMGHAVEPRRGDRTIAVAQTLGRLSWRYRWQLTPAAAAGTAAIGAAVNPGATVVAAAALGVAGHLTASHAPERIAGRAWLSVKERGTVGLWGAGTAAYAAGAGASWWPAGGPGLAVLAALTGTQSVSWWLSRRIRRQDVVDQAPCMSEAAAQLIAAWPWQIGQHGPRPLLGSVIDPTTLLEPAEGVMSFYVDLAAAVHGEGAIGDEVRRGLERALAIGVGTVSLEVDRSHAGRIKVTLAPSRHLELEAAAWPGPVLLEDGRIPYAITHDGTDVHIALHNRDGVEHMGIFGAPGTGKSNSLVARLLPGVIAGREVVVYVDGGNGTSAGFLAGAIDWWAVDGAQEWRSAIHAVHAIMRARKARRAAAGLSRWRGAEESDPIVTLAIDEATTVLRALEELKDATTVAMVGEILREGRKLGIALIQSTQDPMGSDLIGGRQARGFMTGAGSLIGHRPGDGVASMLAGGSTSQQVDLRDLPPGPGWVAVIRQGQIEARKARVRYADPDTVLEILDGFTPRELTDQDRAAAGPAYAGRLCGVDAAARMRGEEPTTTPATEPAAVDDVAGIVHDDVTGAAAAPVEIPTEIPAEISAEVVEFPQLAPALTGAAAAKKEMGRANRLAVLAAVRGVEEGLTSGQLVQELTTMSKATIHRATKDLAAAGLLVKVAGSWRVPDALDVDELDDQLDGQAAS